MHLLRALLALTLFVTPGAWIAFTACDRRWEARAKWAAALVLSPIVLALEIIALTAVGLAFARAVPIAAVANLPAIALIVLAHRHRADERVRGAGTYAIIACIIMLGPVVFFWLHDPDYRIYGWHNAMNGAMTAQIERLPQLPEEPDLANVRLNYGWLGHTLVTAVARLSDVGVTRVYPIENISMAIALFLFMQCSAEQFRPRKALAATLSASLVIVGTMLTGLLVELVIGQHNPRQVLRGLTGDLRPCPLLTKFDIFDAMTIAIAATAGIVHAIITSWTIAARRTWLLIGLFLADIALMYPIMFPMTGVLAGVTFLFTFDRRRDAHSSLTPTRWLLALACLIAGCALLVYVRSMSAGERVSYLAPFELKVLGFNAITAFHVLALWTWIAWPTIRDSLRTRSAPALCLLAGIAVILVMAVLIQMTGKTQYKMHFVMAVAIAPLMVRRIDGWLGRFPRVGGAMGFALVGLLSVLTAARFYTRAPHDPLSHVIQIDDSHYALQPPPNRGLDWIPLVQRETPLNAVIVTQPSPIPVAFLTGRTQYVGEHIVDHPILGYTMTVPELLQGKGYPTALRLHREAIKETCFTSSDPAALERATGELRALHRPVVIVFDATRTSAYLAWLRDHNIGRAIYEADAQTLWMID